MKRQYQNTVMGLLAAAAAVGFSSCNVSVAPAQVATAWYDVYGNYCFTSTAPGPGCDFYSDGAQVTYQQDPYTVSLNYGTYYYNDVYGNPSVYVGYVYDSPDGVLYDENGYALNSENDHGKDTITNAAAKEKQVINAAASGLQAKYGLSADVSMNVAVSLNQWALIGKTRKRTDADLAAFTKRLTGLDISQVNAALEAASKGDSSAADQAIAQVANNWSTSPDTMKQILNHWFAGQAQKPSN